ncbi:hypothetical protein ACXWO6_09300, partial [Streptococcus pyogenes]
SFARYPQAGTTTYSVNISFTDHPLTESVGPMLMDPVAAATGPGITRPGFIKHCGGFLASGTTF